MYRISLPSDCQPQASSPLNWRLGLAVVVSVLAHILLVWLVFRQPESGVADIAKKPVQTMEVSLTALPAAKPKPAEAAPQPVPPRPAAKLQASPLPPPIPRPKPVVWPKPPKPPTPPKPDSPPPTVPRKPPEPPKPPPEPEPMPSEDTQALPEPAPETPPEPPPQKTGRGKHSKPAKEAPLPEFKDDFAQLSTTYSRDAKDKPTLEPPAGRSTTADNGIQTGAILNINPRIYYPRDAMNKGMKGVVVVLLHISIEGHVTDIDLIQSSGYDELDNQVLGAVQHWRFTPPKRGNTPVESTFKHTVIFGENEEVIDGFAKHWREIKLLPANH